MTVDTLLKEVQKLPEAERLALIERVLSSFAPKELSEEHKQILDIRSEEIKNKTIDLLPSDKFLSTLHKRYAL